MRATEFTTLASSSEEHLGKFLSHFAVNANSHDRLKLDKIKYFESAKKTSISLSFLKVKISNHLVPYSPGNRDVELEFWTSC